MRKTLLLLFLAALGASACVGTRASSTTRTPSDQLLRTDIENSAHSNAYDLVRQARPSWLRIRGVTSINNNQPVAIYVDGVRLGGPETLSTISTMSVESMEFLSAPEAQARFGLNNTQGVIAVRTRTR